MQKNQRLISENENAKLDTKLAEYKTLLNISSNINKII